MSGEFKPSDRVRHVKRSTFYRVVGSAQVQAPEDHPLADYEVVTIYQCEEDGETWVRRSPEFRDGRFELVEPAPASPAAEPEMLDDPFTREEWKASAIGLCEQARRDEQDMAELRAKLTAAEAALAEMERRILRTAGRVALPDDHDLRMDKEEAGEELLAIATLIRSRTITAEGAETGSAETQNAPSANTRG